jgi:arabinofuranosyltransferase
MLPSVKHNAANLQPLPGAFVYAAVLFLTYLSVVYYIHTQNFGIDDSYITYRYAYNLAEGYGAVFNIDERHYGSTATGYALLLAVIAKTLSVAMPLVSLGFLPAPDLTVIIPVIARVISTSSLLVSAILFLIISRKILGAALGGIVGLLTGMSVLLSTPASEVTGHETYLFLALWLAASYLVSFGRAYLGASFLLAIATAVRPDTLLFAGVLFVAVVAVQSKHLTISESLRQFSLPALVYLALIAFWFLTMWAYYGQPFPETRIAKHAQVALGYWPLFSLPVVISYLDEALNAGVLALMTLGGIAAMLSFWPTRAASEGLSQCTRIFGIAWAGTIVGVVIAYMLLNVTFWSWYGIPIWFGVLSLTPIFVKLLVTQLARPKRLRNLNATLAALLVGGALMLDATTLWKRFVTMQGSVKANAHVGSYDGVIELLRERHPEGTSLAMAEPGYVGFFLGPDFKVVDLLGLTSPGVARAILQGDMDFPFTQWSPHYVVSSWPGSYDPTHRDWFEHQYRLDAQIEDPFWERYINGPYRLFQRLR